MLEVIVHLTSGIPIKIECLAHNDIVYHSDMICIHNLMQKWVFMKSEIEYIKIERKEANETQQR